MKIKLRIWAIAILLAFLIPVVAVSTAAATQADHDNHLNRGMGMITFTQGAIISGPTGLSDHTTIVTAHETLSFTGSLAGTALTIERDVIHTVTDQRKTVPFTTFHGNGTFTGTLDNNQVTLHIRYEGVKNSTFTRGNFVIHGDTSQMNDVQGEGHFNGTLTGGNESGGQSPLNSPLHRPTSTHTEEPEDPHTHTDTD